MYLHSCIFTLLPEIGNAENGMLPRTNELLTEVFKNSEVGKQLDKEGRGIVGSSPEKGSIKEQEITYATSFIQQVRLELFARNVFCKSRSAFIILTSSCVFKTDTEMYKKFLEQFLSHVAS